MPAVPKTTPRKIEVSQARAVPTDDPDDDPAFDPPTAIVSSAIPPQLATQLAHKEKESNGSHATKDKDGLGIEDLNLPKSIITRLAKGVLPPNTQIQANAILALSKSATLFVNYLASHANENTLASGKKTIMPTDVFKAIEETEFGFMRAKLEAEFTKFHETNSVKRSTYRKRVAMAKKGSNSADVSIVSSVPDDPSSIISEINGSSGDHVDVGASGGLGQEASIGTIPRSKKPKLRAPRDSVGDRGAIDTSNSSNIEVDDDEDEPISDADTIPDEPQDEDEEEDDDLEEDEDLEEDGEEDEDENVDMDEDQRARREARRTYDEAVDNGSDDE